MNDPKRLVEDDEGSDLEKLLLDAARTERPRSSLIPRMLAGLGLGLGLTQTAVPLAAAVKIGAGVWVSIGVLAAVGAGYVGVRASSPAPAASAVHAPAPVVSVVEPPPVSRDANLRDEIRLLDRARAALRMRAPSEALDSLRQYFDGHPRGTLEPEATVLRIEALLQSGQRVQAAAAAREFLTRHPDGPLADRVRRGMADSKPSHN
jgi:hypothetical protein